MTMKKLQHRQSVQPNSIQEPHDMEVVILKALQQEFNPDTSLSSPLAKLDPYTDSNAIIRVGGWLNLSDFPGHFPSQCIDATILPTIGDVTDLIFRHFHHKGKQQGRGNTTNEIRATGYWIVGATCAVSSIIYHCVPCKNCMVHYKSNVWWNYHVIDWNQLYPSPTVQSIALPPS